MSLPSSSAPVQTNPTPLATGAETPLQGWWQRSGISGKLLAFGGVAGVLFAFFTAVTVTTSLLGEQSIRVVGGLQGKLGFVAYIGCIVFAFRLYRTDATPSRKQLIGMLACAGVAVLMGVWQLFDAMSAGAQVTKELGSLAEGIKITTSVGLGTYLTLLAAVAVAAGAGLKAKEEEMF